MLWTRSRMRMNWMLKAILMPKVGGCRDDVTTRRCAAWLELAFGGAGRAEFLVGEQ